ncbi:MAG: RdgB/HAM1 family non-canonical purine NTP pyrophosphatase [Candidatus Omnitrophota bacterium]
MTRILVATHNHKKRRELKALLKEFKKVKVLDFDNLDVASPNVVEDGKTFRQNAVKKAVTVSKFFDGLVLADDSGLEVDALDGKPGIRSARFARAKATDDENNKKLLFLLEDVPGKNRNARFVCHIALARKGHLLGNFEGVVKGKILIKPRGNNGFGYDPVFLPAGYKRTYAQMAPSFKNRISHRSAALKELKQSIKKYLS